MRKWVNWAAVWLSLMYSLDGQCQQYFYNDKYYDSEWLIEAGVGTGVINALTDLGGRKGKGAASIKDLTIKNSKAIAGFHLSLLHDYKLALSLHYTHGNISAQDSILNNEKDVSHSRYFRNLHFRSVIREASARFEWHFWRTFNELDNCSPYIITGIGYYQFRPQALYKQRWIDLQPLHTEGQGFPEYSDRKPYSLKQFNLPLGLGIQYELSALVNLRLELINRILFTDYLDDVSTNYIDPSLFSKYLGPDKAAEALVVADRRREIDPGFNGAVGDKRGNSSRNDSYFTIDLGIGLVLNRKRR